MTPARAVAAAATIAIVAVAIASVSPAFHALPFMAPDSVSYLQGDVGRTPAYPLLLRAIPLNQLATVQLVTLALTAAWLAVEASALGPILLAVGLEISILANPALMSYASTVLPEAFFVAAVQAHLAIAIRLLRKPTEVAAAALGVNIALLILLKPSGYSFLAAVPVLLWLMRAHVRIVGGPLIAALITMLVVAGLGNLARSGIFATQAYGGYAAIGYVAPLLDEGTPTAYPRLTTSIVSSIETSRLELERIADLDLYFMASSSAYHDVLDTVRPLLLAAVHESDPTLTERAAFVEVNAIAQSLSISAVAHQPTGYIRHASAHLYGLWLLPLIRNRADHDRFSARLTALTAAAPYTMRHSLAYREVPAFAYWPTKLVLFLALAASLLGLALVRRADQRADRAALAYAAVVVHANFLLVSAVQTGLPRYALAMWPATMMVLIFGLLWCGRAVGVVSAARAATRRDVRFD